MIIEEITEAEVMALADRIDLALANGEGISRDDLALLRKIFDTWLNIADGVREGSMSMRRLKKKSSAPVAGYCQSMRRYTRKKPTQKRWE